MSPALSELPPPTISFASDNAAAVHPAVMDALVAANDGSALAYGADAWTDRVERRFAELFGTDVLPHFTDGRAEREAKKAAELQEKYEALQQQEAELVEKTNAALLKVIDAVASAMFNVTDYVMRTAPLGVFAARRPRVIQRQSWP